MGKSSDNAAEHNNGSDTNDEEDIYVNLNEPHPHPHPLSTLMQRSAHNKHKRHPNARPKSFHSPTKRLPPEASNPDLAGSPSLGFRSLSLQRIQRINSPKSKVPLQLGSI
jgi:hypothetical protein